MADEIWIRRCSSFEEEADADAEFWRKVPPAERVAVVEEMRLGKEDGERLRRVVRVFSASRR